MNRQRTQTLATRNPCAARYSLHLPDAAQWLAGKNTDAHATEPNGHMDATQHWPRCRVIAATEAGGRATASGRRRGARKPARSAAAGADAEPGAKQESAGAARRAPARRPIAKFVDVRESGARDVHASRGPRPSGTVAASAASRKRAPQVQPSLGKGTPRPPDVLVCPCIDSRPCRGTH